MVVLAATLAPVVRVVAAALVLMVIHSRQTAVTVVLVVIRVQRARVELVVPDQLTV